MRLFNLKQLDFEAKKTNKKQVCLLAVGPCFISACPSCGIKFPERLSVRSDLSCLVPTVPGPCQVPHGAAAFRVRASAQPWDRTPDEPEHLQSISVSVQNILPLLLTVLTTGTVFIYSILSSPAYVEDSLLIFNPPDAWIPISIVMSQLIWWSSLNYRPLQWTEPVEKICNSF